MTQVDEKFSDKPRILILGALGQIGIVLTKKLREIYGNSNVVASDIKNDCNSYTLLLLQS